MLSGLDAHRHAIETCVFCPKLCRWACPVAEAEGRETVTPWGLMTRLDDARQGRAPFDEATAELWEHCTGCRRCQTACAHQIDVPEVLAVARAASARDGMASPSLLAWARRAVDASPGSAGAVRLMSGRAAPAEVAASGRLLRAAGYLDVGAASVSDTGGALRSAGLLAEARARLSGAVGAARGAECVVCLDPEDVARLRGVPAAEGERRPRVLHLCEAVDGRLPPLRVVEPGDLLYLDACALGRGLGIYEPPRAALRQVVGGRLLEALTSRAEAGCCGAGWGFAAAHPEQAARVAEESVADHLGVPVVMAVAACAAHLRSGVPERRVWGWAQIVAAGLPEGEGE